jgi:hypothetical protein
MKNLITISGAALLAASVASAAFAQTGGNMNAPEPNSSGTKIIQPGTTSTGVATDSHKVIGTTGSASGMRPNNAELQGNNGNSAGGSNSSANTNNPTGMGNNAGAPMK